MTLYETADPSDLGQHRSDAFPPAPFAPYEADRGIIYTTRGGFVDVAHIRKTIDLTRYLHHEFERAIKDRETTFAFDGSDRVRYRFTFNYPATWDAMPDAQRTEVRHQLARVHAQRVAYGIMTWHEVQTWYGYRNGAVFDETASAFSYDDAMSHWVGMEVAGRALQWREKHPLADFDKAATDALNDVMKTLGAVSPDETDRAVAAVEGKWWRDGRPLKRHVHVGLSNGYLQPWLIPNAAGTTSAVQVPQRFRIPQLSDVRGGALYANFLTVEMELGCWEANTIAQRLGRTDNLVNLDRDLPRLLQTIETEVQQQYGRLATPVTLSGPGS